MSITPQTIKDQEFQVKFRGYDTIEVKAYLDLVAEEFFDLHEAKRKQEEEYAELNARYQSLLDEKDSLEKTIQDSEAYSGEAQKEQLAREMEFSEMQKRADRFEAMVKELEKEKGELLSSNEGKEKDLAEEVKTLRATLSEQQTAVIQANAEVEKLQHQLKLTEQKAEELKKDEMIFKSTIVAAQTFADDLKKKSQAEADEMMAQAKTDVESFRLKAEAELSRLPKEISQLVEQKAQVRKELKQMLTSYMDKLEIFGEENSLDASGDEISELFTAIRLPDEDSLDSEMPKDTSGRKK